MVNKSSTSSIMDYDNYNLEDVVTRFIEIALCLLALLYITLRMNLVFKIALTCSKIKRKNNEEEIINVQPNLEDVENISKRYDICSMHKAAIYNNANRVKHLLNESDDKTEEMFKTDRNGVTRFYYIMKNCPQVIENLLDECMNFETSNKEDIEIHFDPLSNKNVDKFFSEICKIKLDPSVRSSIDRLFSHPATNAYFYQRWSQVKYIYWIVPLLDHLIYSIFYTTYVLIVYRNLCTPDVSRTYKNEFGGLFTPVFALKNWFTDKTTCNGDYDIDNEKEYLVYI